MKRIKAVIKKEFKHILRDKRSLGLLIFIPILMLILFGYALSFDVKNVKLTVVDKAKTPGSRKLIDKFVKTEYFKLQNYQSSEKDIYNKLDRKETKSIMIIPSDYSKELGKNQNSKVMFIIDGVDSNTASTIQGYISKIVYSVNNNLKPEFQNKNKEPVNFKPRIWYNPELKSQVFLVPGLIVYILMIITVVSTSLTIVREREENTIEQLIVSPLHSFQLIIGKIVPYVIVTFSSSLSIIILGYLFFGVAVKGSLILLLISMIIFLLVGVSFGLMISAVADSQEFAFMISVFTTVLPTLLLSGFVFPIRNMPKAIQLFSYLVPARYFMDIIRGIIIKGTGFFSFWLEFVILTIIAVFLLFVSSQKLKRKLS